ncbi:MAG TPA: HD domain-containing protein [Rhodanobacteraceae bacterium]|nr:HD domain-containing protein [Rhodanobacteraceae bacterium]
MMLNEDRLGAALALAHDAHCAQKRKGTDIPYIAHPMAVASLVLEYGGTETQAMAALLHDAIEDGGADYDNRIGEAFGMDVLEIVRDCTDGTAEAKAVATTPEDKRAAWKARKLAYLKHLEAKPAATPSLLVSACDKLHNARAIVSDLHDVGVVVFERFKAGREGTLWYYGELARIFKTKDVAPADSLARAVDAMQRLAAAD